MKTVPPPNGIPRVFEMRWLHPIGPIVVLLRLYLPRMKCGGKRTDGACFGTQETLRARTHIDVRVQEVESLGSGLDERTDRQREVLVAAFRNGYFVRPRVTNAQEIASQIGISSSTFHQHLRATHMKLLTVLLESDPQTQTPWH